MFRERSLLYEFSSERVFMSFEAIKLPISVDYKQVDWIRAIAFSRRLPESSQRAIYFIS